MQRKPRVMVRPRDRAVGQVILLAPGVGKAGRIVHEATVTAGMVVAKTPLAVLGTREAEHHGQVEAAEAKRMTQLRWRWMALRPSLAI